MRNKFFFKSCTFCSFLVLSTSLLVGCASPTNKYAWEKAFHTNVPVAQAEAQCEYDYKMQLNANVRAGYSRDVFQMINDMRPHTNQTIVACMKSYGYSVVRTE